VPDEFSVAFDLLNDITSHGICEDCFAMLSTEAIARSQHERRTTAPYAGRARGNGD